MKNIKRVPSLPSLCPCPVIYSPKNHWYRLQDSCSFLMHYFPSIMQIIFCQNNRLINLLWRIIMRVQKLLSRINSLKTFLTNYIRIFIVILLKAISLFWISQWYLRIIANIISKRLVKEKILNEIIQNYLTVERINATSLLFVYSCLCFKKSLLLASEILLLSFDAFN